MRNSGFFLAALAILAGPAWAQQQTIDESLTEVSVFDCAIGGQDMVLIFRKTADGKILLVGDETSPVRATEDGLTFMALDGMHEITDGAYHIYGAGTAESGTCDDITAFAHTLYPAMTLAYVPDAEGASVAEQAAAASLADLNVRTERALEDTAAAMAERDAMQAELEARTNELAAAMAEVEDLNARLSAAMAELASVTEAMERLTEERDGLATLLGETETALGETASTLEATEVKLEELRALHASATSAATDFQGQLGAATQKLVSVEADNRTLVATVAGLNSKISDLGSTLRSTRAERDAALKKAESAGSSVVSTSSLTNAAIARIATLQGRSQNAVRSELCRIIGRSGGC